MALVPDHPTPAGRVRFLRHRSTLLAGNRYGDPAERAHPVWLPPSWEEGGDRRYPVVLGLVGYTSTGLHMFSPGTFSESMPERLSRLVDEGMPEIIFVAPDCMTHLGGSQYADGAAGPYASYLVDELLPAILEELPANGRFGVVGKSSGGFGALHLAMEYPGRFHAVACHSGDMGFEYSVLPNLTTLVDVLGRFDGDEDTRVRTFLRAFHMDPKPAYDMGHALMMLACAAAYSPDDEAPLGFRLPCDPHTGALRDEVWERWLAFDPVRRAAEEASALSGLDWLHIECGSRDQYALHLGARQLHALLREAGIHHSYEEFPDDHSGINYRYDASLPRMASVLSRKRGDQAEQGGS